MICWPATIRCDPFQNQPVLRNFSFPWLGRLGRVFFTNWLGLSVIYAKSTFSRAIYGLVNNGGGGPWCCRRIWLCLKKQTKKQWIFDVLPLWVFYVCLFCPNMLPLKQMTEFSSILTVLALMLIYHSNR